MANKEPAKADFLQGTLDLMVLQTVAALGPLHGYAVASHLEQVSNGTLRLNIGTLSPGLMRLEQRGLARDVGVTGTNRKARLYAITAAGRRRLTTESVTYAIRSPRTGTSGFLDEIRSAVWAVDSNLPLVNVRTMSDILGESMARTSFTLVMLAVAGGMALLLGVIGIYGVISYAICQRTREVGIRIALGAQSGEIRSMFVRQGLVLTAVGVAVGLGGAVALTRWMSSLLFEVSPLDPVTYAAVSVALFVAAALAIYLPCRRATRIDPLDALRAE